MASSSLTSAFLITLLRNGVNAYIQKSVVSFDSSGNETAGSLLQIYDGTTGAYSVDWSSDYTSQPCLKLTVKTSDGGSVTLNSVTFAYDGTALDFSALNEVTYENDGNTWYLDSTGKFAYARLADSDGVSYFYLRVVGNLASSTALQNTTIEYTIAFTSATAGSGTLTGTEDVLLHSGGGDSYSVNITLDEDTIFEEGDESITLKAVAYRGVTALTIGDTYQIIWYKNATTFMGVGEELTIDPDDVDSTAVFTAYLTNDGSAVDDTTGGTKDGYSDWDKCASDSIRITDNTDPYQFVDSYTYGGVFSATQDETLTLKLMKGDEQVTSGLTWTWNIRRGDLSDYYEEDQTSSEKELSVKITYAMCSYESTIDNVTTTVTSNVNVVVTVAIE